MCRLTSGQRWQSKVGFPDTYPDQFAVFLIPGKVDRPES